MTEGVMPRFTGRLPRSSAAAYENVTMDTSTGRGVEVPPPELVGAIVFVVARDLAVDGLIALADPFVDVFGPFASGAAVGDLDAVAPCRTGTRTKKTRARTYRYAPGSPPHGGRYSWGRPYCAAPR